MIPVWGQLPLEKWHLGDAYICNPLIQRGNWKVQLPPPPPIEDSKAPQGAFFLPDFDELRDFIDPQYPKKLGLPQS